ncbi:MAG: hypothetical protein Q9173_005275 [Seirophora scorigena]
MRVAIDASIWQFQTQAGQGGSNPALRTLYYRLIRLLSLSIRPLFIFDGPNKPPFKRNVKTGSLGAQLPNFITKQLLDVFGFPYHTAPGEAEAECALLQKTGLVDAVLSEDVDTMMFGCTVHLRNWSAENVRGNKSPTHVNMYKAEDTRRGKSGLDREGMILIALMSGGDYIPAGVPGCGIKIACEAARAGFGRDLCRLPKKDVVAWNQWRERLQYELRVNETGFFRTKHKALAIPEGFPDRKVLRYYTDPAVSTPQQLDRLRDDIKWDGSINLPGLRHFVAEAFEWQNLSGAKRFVRTLAPALLVDQLCRRYNNVQVCDDLKAQEAEEGRFVSVICGRRSHWVTDAVPELRIAYTPIEIVGLDLEAEEPDPEYATFSESDQDIQPEDPRGRSRSPAKRSPSTYDPTQPEKIWMFESYVKFGVPLMVENWEGAMRDPKKFASRKARERTILSKKTKKPEVTKPGAMYAYVKTTKPGIDRSQPVKRPELFLEPGCPSTVVLSKGIPTESVMMAIAQATRHPPISTTRKVMPAKVSKPSLKKTPTSIEKAVNPWTLAKRVHETPNARLPPGTRYSASDIYGPSLDAISPHSEKQPDDTNLADSQLPTPSSSGSRRRRSRSEPRQLQHSEGLTTKRVNRKLDFVAPDSPIAYPRPTTPDSLPSPSTVMSRPEEKLLAETVRNSSPNYRIQDPPCVDSKRGRALLALRESLDGSWRDIQPWERRRGYIKRVYEQVEVIDLTKT